METAIKIGFNVDPVGIEAAADGIVRIFASGHVNHMDQETVRHAIDKFTTLFKVENVSINNCNIEDNSSTKADPYPEYEGYDKLDDRDDNYYGE